MSRSRPEPFSATWPPGSSAARGTPDVPSASRPADGLLVDGDATRLEQALDNLVENAFAHGAGAVALAAVQKNGRVELHVTDEGAGVPSDFLPRAFDRFSRADEARGRGGTGLGLAIVDLVARAHGGEARLENRPGGGADAWIAIGATHSNL